MSKTKEAIEIEFSKAMMQAEELDDMAGSLTVLANSLSCEKLERLRNSWKGGNADKMGKSMQELSQDMYDTAQNFVQISSCIRSTANLVYKAEKAALYLAYT